MKYCPYCGADFADGAASFCMECGKSLPIAEDGQKKPKEKPVKSQKRMEKKRKHPSPKPQKKHEKPVGIGEKHIVVPVRAVALPFIAGEQGPALGFGAFG